MVKTVWGVLVRVLVFVLAAAAAAAVVGGLFAAVAGPRLVPSLGLAATRSLLRAVILGLGAIGTLAAFALGVRSGLRRLAPSSSSASSAKTPSSPGRPSGPGILSSAGKRAHQGACCLLAFLLAFSLIGDGAAAYADELRAAATEESLASSSGEEVTESGEGEGSRGDGATEPAGDGASSGETEGAEGAPGGVGDTDGSGGGAAGTDGPGSPHNPGLGNGSSAETQGNLEPSGGTGSSGDSDGAGGALPELGEEGSEGDDAQTPEAPEQPLPDGAPDPYEILNAPADYYDEPEPEGELVSFEDGVTVYRLSNTEYRTVIGGAATAFTDESGEAQLIDNTLVPKEEDEGILEALVSLFGFGVGDTAAEETTDAAPDGEAAEGSADEDSGGAPDAAPDEADSAADPLARAIWDGPAPTALLLGDDGQPEPDAVSPATVYEPAAAAADIAIPACMDAERGISIAKEGHEIRLVPEGGTFTGSVASGNAIRYTEVHPGIDYQYTLVGSLLKEDIVLTRPAEPVRLATRIEVDSSLTVALEGGTVVIREKPASGADAPGREIASLAAPIAVDAADAIDNSLTLTLEEADDGTPVAVVNANWEWLLAAERAYPVRIDPTIDIATTAMRLTSVEELAPTIWVGENNYQYSGYDDGDKTGTGDYRGGVGLGICRVYLDINYDFGNIMDEAVIKSAQLKMHQRTKYSGGATEFGLYRNKSSWTFGDITWNSQKSMGHEFVTSQNARSTKGYLTWDVREPVNNWVQGIWAQNGLCVKATNERWMQCELFDHRYSDNPPSLEIDWEVPDPVSESLTLNSTTINLRTVTEADFSGKLQFDGVFADGVAKPRSMVAYELVGKSDAGVAYASRSYKYPDSSEWEKALPNGTKYRDKLSNWQSKLFGSLSYNTSYKIRARAAADGKSGKLVETDSFLIYRATAKDTLPSIADHYGVTLNTLAKDNRVQDTLVVGGNTIFVRNPKTTTAYNPKQLTDTQKKRIDSALMGRGKHCEYGFEPINLNTGNFILEATDATVPQVEGDFALARTYNAQGDGYSSPFGRNWSFSWDETLGLQANGAAVYSVGDGKTFWFDADGKGGFKANVEEGLTLSKIAYKSGSATLYRWEIASAEGEVRRFDCYGRLTEVQTPGGSVTKIARDAKGHLASLTAPNGAVFAITCNTDGLITGVTLPGGAKLAYGYKNGNLASFTDAAGRTVRYEYDSANRMSAWYDQNGRRVVANTYDSANRVTRQVDLAGRASTIAYGSGYTRATDAAGRTTTYRYDSRNRTTAIEYPDGQKVARTYGANNTLSSDEDGTYAYDSKGNLTSATSVEGITTRYTYDGKCRLTSETAPDGAVTRYAYDGRGNLTSVTAPATGTTTYTYDGSNRLTSATDADGVRETYDWSGANLISKTTAAGTTRYAYDAMGRKVSETDPAGHTQKWVYDAAGRLIGEQDGAGAYTAYQLDGVGLLKSTTDAGGYTTAFTYDGGYNIATMTDPAGGVTRYAYDAAGNLTQQTDPNGAKTTYAYDVRDRLVSETDALGHTTSYGYDAYGNLVWAKAPDGSVEKATYNRTYGAMTSYTDAAGNVTSYDYDAAGRPTAVTAADGTREESAWKPGGLQASATDARGVTTTYGYSAAGRTTSIDEAGQEWTFSYDAGGNMASATDPAGRTFTFAWDAAGNLASLADDEGVLARWTYDGAARVTSETDALGAATRYAYDARGNLVCETDPRGAATAYAYDAFGAVTAKTDALGRTVRCEYDTAGNPVAVTDAAGNRRTAAYDLLGRMTEATDARGNATGYSYDALGQLTSLTRPDGAKETFEYDALGNLVRSTDAAGRATENTYDIRGNLLATTDAAGRTYAFEYDAGGNITGATDAAGRRASIEYDIWGRQVRETDFDGATTAYEYDTAGNIVRATDAMGQATAFAWDTRGNLVGETREADGAASTYAYDAAGNLTAATDAMGYVKRWAYDAAGNVVESVDEEGNATAYAYDALGQPTSVTDPVGATTRLEWDAAGNLAATVSAEGSRDEYAYDGDGNLVSHTDPLGNAEAWEWDALGNLARHTDKAGEDTTYAYDVLGNLLAETDPLGRATAYEYDEAGNVCARITPGGNRWEYQWDVLDQLTGIVTPRGYVRQLAYDEAGNAVEDRDNLGARAAYTYDALHRPLTQTDAAGRQSTWEYDAAGRLAAETDATGARTEYAYDALDRLVSRKDTLGRTARWSWDARGNLAAQGGSDIEGLVFTWDAVGNLESQTDARGNATAYEWDADGRLAAQTSAAGARTTYTWDKAANLTSATDSLGRVSSWEYDALGRTVRATDRNGNATAYEWDAASQLARVTSPTGAQTAYAYDADGNLTQVEDALGRITKYGYDAEGGLVSVESPSGALEEFVRDPAGRVLAATDAAGNVTRYDWDELDNLVQKGYSQDASQGVLYRYDANGLVTARADAEGTAETERDSLGRVTAEVDGQGRRVEYAWDEQGQLAEVTYPDGSKVAYGYDEAGNLSVVEASEGIYEYAYDEENRPVSLTRPDGSATTYAYDAEGQLTRLENRDGEGGLISRFTYQWDGEGNPVAEEALATVADGGRTRTVRAYAYDGDNRLVSLEEATWEVEEFDEDAEPEEPGAPDGDDPDGDVSLGDAVEDPSEPLTLAETEEPDFDASESEEDDPFAGADEAASHFSETYEWDAAGNRTAVERTDLSSGELHRTELVYDDDDRLVESVGPEGRTTYRYDDAGNLVEKTAAGEDPVEYAYTVENRLSAVRQGGRVLMAATYDGDGNKVLQASLYATKEIEVGSMPFSWLQEREAAHAPDPEREPADPWTGPTRVAPLWTASEFAAAVESGALVPGETAWPRPTWAAGKAAAPGGGAPSWLRWGAWGAALGAVSPLLAANPAAIALAAWLDALLDPSVPDGASPFGAPVPSADAALSRAGLDESERRRVTALSSPAAPSARTDLWHTATDPAEPVKIPAASDKTVGLLYGTVPTFAPYTQERWELVEYVNSAVIDDVPQTVWRESSVTGDLADVYGVSRLSTTGGREGLSVSDTYLEDGLGSVSAVLREGGSVAVSYAYDPWGGESQAMESVPGIGSRFELPHYGYNAEEASPATGSQYLRARWYDPSMGAFGSRDAYLGDATDPSTLNRYAYAEGNPVSFSDPTGHVTAARNRQKKQQAATQRARQAAKGRSSLTKTSGGTSSKKSSSISSMIKTVAKKAKVAVAPKRVIGDSAPIINARLSTRSKGVERAKTSSYPNRLGSSNLLSKGRGRAVSTPRGSYRLGAYSTSYRRGVGAIMHLCNSSPKMQGYGITPPETNPVDIVHIGLTVPGLVSGWGDGFDLVDGIISLLEGDLVGAGLSGAAMLPNGGAVFGVGKLARTGFKIAKATESTTDVGRAARTLEEAAEKSSGAKGITRSEPQASDPVGRWSLPLNGAHDLSGLQQGRRNESAIINGRLYVDHALDRMQERGFTPSMIEEVIAHGRSRPDPKHFGRMQYYDPVSKIKVILTSEGHVVTVVMDSKGF